MTDPIHIVAALAFVGLVMALVLMYRKLAHLEAQEARRKQLSELNLQMRAFAEVTMRILGGEESIKVLPEAAQAIANTTPFSKVSIAIVTEMQGLDVLGSAGLSNDELDRLQSAMANMSAAQLQNYCVGSPEISPKSTRVEPRKVKISETMLWPSEDSVIVNITSTRGPCAGLIQLSGIRPKTNVDAPSMVGIELLASHIALSMENAVAKKRTFQSEKLQGMGQLVAGVAHELNNPLTAVLGYTEILTEKTNDPSVRYDLSVMRREALRMKRIIESLQQFSRKQKVEREKVNLLAAIEDAIRSRADEIREQKIEIVKQVDPALPSIVGNQTLLEQVLNHVFANAMEAVHNAGLKRILIEARALGDQVHVQISDSGLGFKDAGRVFDPFYTTKGPGKGTGLGLSLCYGIIRDHGGEITASNLHPLGACISIQLPLVPVESRTQVPPAPASVIR